MLKPIHTLLNALILGVLCLPASQTFAECILPAATAIADYAQFDLPAPQVPTAERPYYYMRLDEQTKAQHPLSETISVRLLNTDKLLVINFIDEKTPQYSNMQTYVLSQTLSALAPLSENKELMLVDVVVRDAKGTSVYLADYELYFKDNELSVYKYVPGENGDVISRIPDEECLEGARVSEKDKILCFGSQSTQLPYGVVWGSPLKEGAGSRLFDFALMNGVLTDADLNANADAISGLLFLSVEAYNKEKMAE